MSVLPRISHNPVARQNYSRLAALLTEYAPSPRVLIVGGGALGEGMGVLDEGQDIDLIETDVYVGERTTLVCDAHDLPFRDASFDAVVAQAVFEHVLDPYRCVAEIHRVLRPGGYVYSETPFMQQVHLGRFDFTRFTHLGHRRLLRAFKEVDSGPVGGPGEALAWSVQYFLLAFSRRRTVRMVVRGFASVTLFWLKEVDRALRSSPGSFDAARAIGSSAGEAKTSFPIRISFGNIEAR